MSRGAEARIDLGALRANLSAARAAAPRSRVMAVVKSDGYGHGLVPVAGALAESADAFAVTDFSEAEALRAAGLRHRIVLLQGPYTVEDLHRAAAGNLELVIHSQWQVAALVENRLPSPVTVWIKVDSGMHRLGFEPESVQSVWRQLTETSSVRADIGFLTHLACADDRDDSATRRQLEVFEAACGGLPGPRSAANSAGVLGWPASHYEWVRPGVMLYGASPFVDGHAGPDLQPAMALEGRVVAVRHLRAGDPVGYGATWRCPVDMPVGIVSLGYGDGYPRHAPSGTPVEVAEVRVPLVGRISMDMLAVDLRGLSVSVREGDQAVAWGGKVRPEEVAKAAGTIAYELFCRTPPRPQRRYVEPGGG